MRTATTVEATRQGTWSETLAFVLEAEKLGLDICWVAEAWGSDAPSPLGYLAARTDRLQLGSGIIQLGTRTPALIAMTAMTLAQLSGGRFLLGLGPSGPQVIEGLHGVSFARPLARMRETIEVVRQAFSGEKITYSGTQFQVPRPGGEARPMRLSLPANPGIPIYIASMSPRMLELTGRVADGWLGTSFVPEGSAAYFEYLDRGLAASGRSRSDLDVCQGAEVAFLDDEDAVAAHVASRKKELAFSLGGMGSASTNFYNQAYSRQGWAEVAAQIQARWQAGDHDGAAGLVTDEMVLGTTLIGTEQMVRERLRVWRDAGVDTVRLYPAGGTLDRRLATLGRAIELVKTIS
ncbi:MAG: LLM class flavin-dependent oxidoreductase [Streptosporangiaceae bacterium]|jgi:F420-dependent oxidoreductase-like protein